MVIFETNKGPIKIQLDSQSTPMTCENFMKYVNDGFYDNTIFHRVISDFMIQGGGFEPELVQKSTLDPIENEADKGGPNKRGSIAMARTSDPHSATAQFFINLKDNEFLNHSGKSLDGWGYCAFGEVVEGMDIVDEISKVSTTTKSGHQDVPEEDVVIEKVTVVDDQ